MKIVFVHIWLIFSFICTTYSQNEILADNNYSNAVKFKNCTLNDTDLNSTNTNKSLCNTNSTEYKIIDTKDVNLSSNTLIVGFLTVASAGFLVILMILVCHYRKKCGDKRTRRYGILSDDTSDLEIAPLDQFDDSDDEDMTLYEVNNIPVNQ
ncbi:hypothetical protein A3Q56_01371 [Intoshia linei]|uniref:Uncharacterized protein n=1 Tax=Intoshia linei TaxID=1819745 RepID=A0A177BBQ8_9BILA|nr:hypothetical protein A3Q56_01371 [Intoshia linei]